MKYFSEYSFEVNIADVNRTLEKVRTATQQPAGPEVLSTIFSLIDLTTLSEQDSNEKIIRMCDQVNLLDEGYPSLPSPAAVCVYPRFVETARKTLSNPLVSLASVAGGFPASQTFMAVKLLETELALETGADEIDVVMSVGCFLAGEFEEVFEEVNQFKSMLGPDQHLKVILESGILPDLVSVQKASILCMEAGADFIKTSTGKAATGATPEAFVVMCNAIKSYYEKTGKKIGIKPAGGISDPETAYLYYSIVKETLGESWLSPEKFRIGASKLANGLIKSIFEKEGDFKYF